MTDVKGEILPWVANPKTAPLGKAGWGIIYFIADTLSFDTHARTLLAWWANVP